MRVSLKGARINAGYKQREIADKLGLNRATIANWESGKVKIPAEYFFELCHIYGATYEDIFLPSKRAKSALKEGGD